MNPVELIQGCIEHTDEVVVTDRAFNIIYRTRVMPIEDHELVKWCEEAVPGLDLSTDANWEITDDGLYYKVMTTPVTDSDGNDYLVHHLYDISDYAGLFGELGTYSKEWRTIADCQNEIMGNLSGDATAALPIARKYYGADISVLFINRNGLSVRHVLYKGAATYESMRITEELLPNKSADGPFCIEDLSDGCFIECAKGRTVSGTEYGLYVLPGDSGAGRAYDMLNRIFKLYIENALLQERIIHESEHDHLTGLYNKGKFMELSSEVFPFCESIAVFNLDVNFLKKTNDTLGHEAGNVLLLKASESMNSVCDDNTYAFRVGGDEFMLISVNITKEEAEAKEALWRENLEKLNTPDSGPECVMACGLVCEQAPYDLEEIYKRADDLMYHDKRELKISRGEDPDSR